MSVEERWNGLSLREKLRLCLIQAEWVLFQANLLDMEIDRRSLGAIIVARRALSDFRDEFGQIKEAKNGAFAAFVNTRGNDFPSITDSINQYALTRICYALIYDIGRKRGDRFDLKIINDYLGVGNLKERSPLARWLAGKEIE